jgi:hypothetical protein
MTPASELLLQAATRRSDDAWLILGGEAILAHGLAADHPAASIEWQATDIREVTSPAGNHPAVRLREVEAAGDSVDVVVLPVPPDRGLARRWLLAARERLGPDGILLLAGANSEGIRSVIGDATALFGEPEFERFARKQRIAAFRAAGRTSNARARLDHSARHRAGLVGSIHRRDWPGISGARVPLRSLRRCPPRCWDTIAVRGASRFGFGVRVGCRVWGRRDWDRGSIAWG